MQWSDGPRLAAIGGWGEGGRFLHYFCFGKDRISARSAENTNSDHSSLVKFFQRAQRFSFGSHYSQCNDLSSRLSSPGDCELEEYREKK